MNKFNCIQKLINHTILFIFRHYIVFYLIKYDSRIHLYIVESVEILKYTLTIIYWGNECKTICSTGKLYEV